MEAKNQSNKQQNLSNQSYNDDFDIIAILKENAVIMSIITGKWLCPSGKKLKKPFKIAYQVILSIIAIAMLITFYNVLTYLTALINYVRWGI